MECISTIVRSALLPRRCRLRALAGLAFIGVLEAAAHPALAAPAPGIVEGVARDAAGRPLAGVQLQLHDPAGAVLGATTSEADGHYRLIGVAPGSYSLTGEKAGFATATAAVVVGADTGASADLALSAQATAPGQQPAAAGPPVEEVTVIAKRLEEARLAIEPQIGASTYTITQQAIQNQPGADNNPLNTVLLQAPGVTQDNLANGAIHVRNEHLGVQYRINGVVIPEGVSFFGQGLSPRFANSMQVITGALPAEYGLRTSGIVDIQTKNGLSAPGGSVGIYGGSYATVQPSVEYGGSAGSYNYYVAGDYLHSNHGLDPVTPAYNQIHDNTNQAHGFAYLDKIIDASSKVSLIAGVFDGEFQIPNNPAAPTTAGISSINGVPITAFDATTLNERQTENNEYAVLSYLRSQQDVSFQISAFTKYSLLNFHGDSPGDIAFNGIAQNTKRTSFANGLQLDSSYNLAASHTLRGGFLVTGERVTADATSAVLPQTGTDAAGNPIFGSTPTTIVDNHGKTGWTYSAYLQDEWRVTPTLTLNYGGRYDVVNQFTTGNQISPRVNAVWQATPSTTFHAGYANYFSPPSFELVSTETVTLFAGTSGAPASTQNSGVKPERAQYFDVGVTQVLLPGLKAGVDAYYKYSRNLVDESQFGAPILLTPFNYRWGINEGVELTTTYDNGPFSFYGNLALARQHAKDIVSAQFNFTPDDLAFAAAHTIQTDHSQIMTASGGVSYLWQNTRFSVDMIAGSGVRTTRAGGPINGGSVPSYEQVNLGVSHRFEDAYGGPITVRLDLINLLDETYLIRSQLGTGVFAPQFGPRRTLFAGVRKEF